MIIIDNSQSPKLSVEINKTWRVRLQQTAKRAFVQRDEVLQWPDHEGEQDRFQGMEDSRRVVWQDEEADEKHQGEEEGWFQGKSGHCRRRYRSVSSSSRIRFGV